MNGTTLTEGYFYVDGILSIFYVAGPIEITASAIVKDIPTSISAIGTDTAAVRTSRGQIHIRLSQEETVTVQSFSGRLVRSFKGAAGDYEIPVQAGAYIVIIDGMVYKVVL